MKDSLIISRDKFKGLLDTEIAKGKEIVKTFYDHSNREIDERKPLAYYDAQFNNWHELVSQILQSSFNNEENQYKQEFVDCGKIHGIFEGGDIRFRLENTIIAFDKSIIKLISLKNRAQYFSTTLSENIPAPVFDDRVFVVHGRDDLLKEQVKSLLLSVGLKPIILHEQPNQGKTIIEKFERESNVGFAVILLTGDDLGGFILDDSNEYLTRARQNVVLEMGYFIGKLGRERIVILKGENLEDEPSDIFGVVYTLVDKNGTWKYELVDELREAGYKVSKDDIRH